MEPKDRIILALDERNEDDARRVLDQVAGHISKVKIGKRLLAATSVPWAVSLASEYGLLLMLDNKEKDIPDTLGDTAEQYAEHNLWGCTVMADAVDDGIARMTNFLGEKGVIAVTVLTSMSEEQCRRIYGGSVGETVKKLAREAVSGGCTHIVCAPMEAKMLRDDPDLASLTMTTPNIRYKDSDFGSQDRNRSMTPAEAVRFADHLVIGSVIRRPKRGTPAEAAQRIIDEIAAVS